MDIDWSIAKKKALWHYEELIQKIQEVLDYGFVLEHYNHNMEEAISYSQKLQRNYLLNGKEPTFISEITKQFKQLKKFEVKNYLDLIQQVNTKSNCVSFLKKVDFGFEELIQLLKYLFRWVFPFRCPVRELVESISWQGEDYLPRLKEFKIRSNLDVLEKCRTKKGRAVLAKETELNHDFILALTHHADISRLAYVRRKTIKHLCGGGYDTLGKIATAHLQDMEVDMTAYYTSLGKRFSDFKAVIPLDWMIGGARALPKIVEE